MRSAKVGKIWDAKATNAAYVRVYWSGVMTRFYAVGSCVAGVIRLTKPRYAQQQAGPLFCARTRLSKLTWEHASSQRLGSLCTLPSGASVYLGL